MEKDELVSYFRDIESFIRCTFSSPKKEKVIIRPITVGGKSLYQVTQHVNNQDIHKNIPLLECESLFLSLLEEYRYLTLFTVEADYHVQVSKKGQITIKSKPPTKTLPSGEHNRQKPYLYRGEKDQRKLKQINQFLQLLSPTLQKLEKIHLLDFGCGKSYLTFALYEYCQGLGKAFSMEGIDLKKTVIEDCQQLANQLKFTTLQFHCADVRDYNPDTLPNVVVALHACNTATDYAIAKAVEWGCEAIFVAPCCQHEFMHQMGKDVLRPISQHGILKERFAAIATDAVRAKLLETAGYSVSVVEFIDSEHTPKNVMIRAEKTGRKKSWNEYEEFRDFLGISPLLETLLKE